MSDPGKFEYRGFVCEAYEAVGGIWTIEFHKAYSTAPQCVVQNSRFSDAFREAFCKMDWWIASEGNRDTLLAVARMLRDGDWSGLLSFAIQGRIPGEYSKNPDDYRYTGDWETDQRHTFPERDRLEVACLNFAINTATSDAKASCPDNLSPAATTNDPLLAADRACQAMLAFEDHLAELMKPFSEHDRNFIFQAATGKRAAELMLRERAATPAATPTPTT